MGATDLQSLDDALNAYFLAVFGGNATRADDDYTEERDAIARGKYVFQIRLIPTGLYYTSNDTRQVVAIQMTLAYRLAAGESVYDYAHDTMHNHMEGWCLDTLWQSVQGVHRVAEGGSFAVTEIVTVGDVVAFSIEGSVIIDEA